MTKILKIAACFLVSSLIFAGRTAVAKASEEPIAGIDVALHELYQSSDSADKEITKYFFEEVTPGNDGLAFAQVTNYVNVRKEASEESDILGKLYNNSAATIIADKGDWYQIKSGSVTGYIKAEFLVTGEKAEKLSKTLGNRLAIVTTTTLKVRTKASTDSDILTLVPIDEDLKVIKELDGWIKVSIGENETGYVSSDYVRLETMYEEAVSIEEEEERLEEEAAANLQAAENASESSSTSNNSTRNNSTSNNNTSNNSTRNNDSISTSTNSSSNNTNSSDNSDNSSSGSNNESSNSSLGSRIASYAVQFKGNPYVWGGTSLTNGADCSGFTQSVFAHFGISIPRTSRTQATGGRRVSLDSLQAGDLIFYARGGTINHVALYIGNGRVISASSPQTGIRITSYNYRQPVKAVSYIR